MVQPVDMPLNCELKPAALVGAKLIPALQSPLPATLKPRIHHVYVLPGKSVTSGAIEQVPVPLAHPTSAAVYQFWISVPEAPLTQS